MIILVLLAMLANLVVVSLPGIVITYLGWKLSRKMQSVLIQTIFRGALVAVALTPSVYGHGLILPAILLIFASDGKDKLAGIVPILVVWIIAVPAIGLLGKKRRRHQARANPS
jgi:hypothetical protein